MSFFPFGVTLLIMLSDERHPKKVSYSDVAQAVIQRSFTLAEGLRHQRAGPEHLLLGFLALGKGVAHRLLSDAGIDFATLRSKILETNPPTADSNPLRVLVSDEWKEVCANALTQPPRKGDIVGSGQFLYAIVRYFASRESTGPLLHFLESKGVTIEKIVAGIDLEIESQTPYEFPDKSKMKLLRETKWQRVYEIGPRNQFIESKFAAGNAKITVEELAKGWPGWDQREKSDFLSSYGSTDHPEPGHQEILRFIIKNITSNERLSAACLLRSLDDSDEAIRVLSEWAVDPSTQGKGNVFQTLAGFGGQKAIKVLKKCLAEYLANDTFWIFPAAPSWGQMGDAAEVACCIEYLYKLTEDSRYKEMLERLLNYPHNIVQGRARLALDHVAQRYGRIYEPSARIAPVVKVSFQDPVVLLAMRARGEWLAADQGFRADIVFASSNGSVSVECSLARTIAIWKSYAVAGSTFIERLVRGTAKEDEYRAFGERLAKQGLSSLAAVEFERANILGNRSERLYAALLDCYRKAGDREQFDITLAAAKAHHPDSRQFKTVGTDRAKRSTAKVGSKASLQYPNWIAWSLPLTQQGHLDINPLWLNDKLICAVADKGPIVKWDPVTTKIMWSFDPNEGLPKPVLNEKGFPEGTWRERSVESLEHEGDSVMVHCREMEMKSPGDGGTSGSSVGRETIAVDNETGKIKSHSQSSENPQRGFCPGRTFHELPGLKPAGQIRDVMEDETGGYVLLEDRRVLRLRPGSLKIIWQSKIDDPPRKLFTIKTVPMVRFQGALLIPGENQGLAALDLKTGKLLWKVPVPTQAPIAADGPAVAIVCGMQAKIVGLEIPSNLKEVRRALIRTVESQKDAALAQELLMNMLDLDPSNEAAYAGLAKLFADRICPKEVKSRLVAFAKLVPADSRAYGSFQRIIRRGTPVRWSFGVSDGVQGFAFDRKRVYILREHALFAVEKESGRQVWDLPLSYRHQCGWMVTENRLIIEQERLILCTPDSRLLGIGASSGRVQWTRQLVVRGTKWLTPLNPAAADGNIFTSIVCGGGKKSYFFRLLALKAKDGHPLWQADVTPDLATSDNSTVASMSPVFHGGKVFFPTVMGNLYAVDAKSGKVQWSFVPERPTKYKHYPLGIPVVDDRRLLVIGPTGMLYSLDPATGALRWKRQVNNESGAQTMINTLCRIGKNYLFRRWNEGGVGLVCLNPDNGDEVWNRPSVHFGCLSTLFRGYLWIAKFRGPTEWGIEAIDPETGASREEKVLSGIDFISRLDTDGKYLYAIHKDGVAQVLP